MSFNLSALLARVESVKVKPANPITLGYASIVRKDTARNIRTLQSIIDESDDIDSHELDSHENHNTLANYEE